MVLNNQMIIVSGNLAANGQSYISALNSDQKAPVTRFNPFEDEPRPRISSASTSRAPSTSSVVTSTTMQFNFTCSKVCKTKALSGASDVKITKHVTVPGSNFQNAYNAALYAASAYEFCASENLDDKLVNQNTTCTAR